MATVKTGELLEDEAGSLLSEFNPHNETNTAVYEADKTLYLQKSIVGN